MIGTDRRAATAAYKERKTLAGIFVIRCGASGQAWVGQAGNIDTIRNRIWFGLRQPGSDYPALKAAQHSHGTDCLTFEILERIDEESPYLRASLLKDRLAYWRGHLGALDLAARPAGHPAHGAA